MAEGSRAGMSTLAATTPAYFLALGLKGEPKFWTQVDSIRAGGETAASVAPRYFRPFMAKRHAQRAELLEEYLSTAADAPPDMAKAYICNIAPVAYFVEGVPGPSEPQRALRADARQTLLIGAIRIARRGAGRCVAHDCAFRDCAAHRCQEKNCHRHRPGALLSRYATGDYCAVCESKVRPLRETDEAERAVFDGAIAAVLGGESRPARRRAA